MLPRLRWTMHATHALTTLWLIGTGILLEFPDLRARVVGGYGREIADYHLWIGWIFLAAPLLAMAPAARGFADDLRRRLGPPDPWWSWRKTHVVVSLASGALLAASGILLWVQDRLPLALADASLELHLIFTWVLVLLLPLHLFAARRRIAAALRRLLRRPSVPTPEELFVFAEDPPDQETGQARAPRRRDPAPPREGDTR